MCLSQQRSQRLGIDLSPQNEYSLINSKSGYPFLFTSFQGDIMRYSQPIICSAFLITLWWTLLGCTLLIGCRDESAKAQAGAEPQVAQANHAVGKITFEDGKPLTGDIKDIVISISGVSEAGERVQYSPVVKNGQYKQKLVPGQFRFDRSTITVRFEATEFTLDLVPVGPNSTKNQDAAEGIVQDFVWKPTGQAETYGAKADPNNATHWHGMNLGLRFTTYREDLKAATVRPPEGTKLTFTLAPTSKSIDGRELQPIVFERDWRPNDVTPNDDLNDFPPADYEITGIAKLPDGSTKSVVFSGTGDSPGYVTKVKVPLEMDRMLGGYAKWGFSWDLN